MIYLPQAAVDFIKHHEGFEPEEYPDVAGIPTIGYGHVIRQGEKFIRLSEPEAVNILCKDMAWAAVALMKLVKVPLNDNQKSALISLIFNIGSGNFQGSVVRSRINRWDYHGAANNFWQWRRSGGKIISGLVRRRDEEMQLFLTP